MSYQMRFAWSPPSVVFLTLLGLCRRSKIGFAWPWVSVLRVRAGERVGGWAGGWPDVHACTGACAWC